MAEETANKDIDKRLDKLINLQGTLADRLSSSRVNLEEAKSLSNTSFTLKQAIAEAKQGQVQKAIDTGQGGAMGARFKGTAQGIGWGVKEALGGKRGMKTDKVGALGAAGSMLGTGALHTMGALTGNPLFNLAGTALSNRRKKITSSRRSYLDSKADNGDNGDQNDTAHEGGTQSSNEVEGGGSEKINEIAANTSRTNEILSGSAEIDSEKIADIAAATDHTNELLDKVVADEDAENAAAQESAEDKNLANDDIRGSSSLSGAGEEAEGAVEGMESAPAESGSMLADGLKSMLGGGGGMMAGMLSAALPILATGLAAVGTAALGGYIGMKVGGMINDKLGLTGDELGDISEKIGMLPSADDIAKATQKDVKDIKDIGKLKNGSVERDAEIKKQLDELAKAKEEALKEENSFFGGLKSAFNNVVVGEGVVPTKSGEIDKKMKIIQQMRENNRTEYQKTHPPKKHDLPDDPNVIKSRESEDFDELQTADKKAAPKVEPKTTPKAEPKKVPKAEPKKAASKKEKPKNAKADLSSKLSPDRAAEEAEKKKAFAFIKKEYSKQGKVTLDRGAIMIDGKYDDGATQDYIGKMYEDGTYTEARGQKLYKLTKRIHTNDVDHKKTDVMPGNKKKSIADAYESSPSAAQAKTDGENAAKPVVVPMPAPAPAPAPSSPGGSSAPVTPVTTGDGIDYGLSQYNSFQH